MRDIRLAKIMTISGQPRDRLEAIRLAQYRLRGLPLEEVT